MKKCLLLWLSLLLFTARCLSACPIEVPKSVETVFTLIYNQQFDKADSMLNHSPENLDNFYHDILKLDLYYWQYSVEKNNKNSRRLKRFLNEFNSKKKSPTDNQLKELIFLSYSARYEFKRLNIPGTIIFRTKIKNLLSEIDEVKLNYSSNRLKLFDLYKVLFAYSDNIFNPFFSENKRTVRENALCKIENYSEDEDLIINTLANYFLGKIYLNIENNPHKSKNHLQLLHEKYPQNASVSELLDQCNQKLEQ